MIVELFLSDRWSLCEFWYYICIFFLFCLLKWTAQSSVFDNVMLTSPDVSDKFKFSPTLLSYVLPSLAPFLAASEIFCLFNYDLRCFNSSSIFLHVTFPIHVVVETNSSRLKSPAQYWSILVFLGCICNIDFSVRQQDTRLSRDCHVFCFERMIFW